MTVLSFLPLLNACTNNAASTKRLRRQYLPVIWWCFMYNQKKKMTFANNLSYLANRAHKNLKLIKAGDLVSTEIWMLIKQKVWAVWYVFRWMGRALSCCLSHVHLTLSALPLALCFPLTIMLPVSFLLSCFFHSAVHILSILGPFSLTHLLALMFTTELSSPFLFESASKWLSSAFITWPWFSLELVWCPCIHLCCVLYF